MTVMFFWECSKINVDSENGENNWEEVFVFEIKASELVALNCFS